MTFGEEEVKEEHENVKKRFQEDRAKGVDVLLVEYLYLSELINVTIEQRLYERLGYSRTRFERHFGSLNSLRHVVAHPARSIITDEHSAKKLWERIDRLEEALFILG